MQLTVEVIAAVVIDTDLALLSPPQYSMSSEPELRPFDPFQACEQEYPITKYQPVYFVAESFERAKAQMRQFAESLDRPFTVHYNPFTQTVEVPARWPCAPSLRVRAYNSDTCPARSSTRRRSSSAWPTRCGRTLASSSRAFATSLEGKARVSKCRPLATHHQRDG